MIAGKEAHLSRTVTLTFYNEKRKLEKEVRDNV